MKTKIKFISLLLMLSIGIWITPQKATAQRVVSYQVFYDELSPYGTWVYTPYGYVWAPDVAPGFTPYASNGYWVYTEEGWTWVSNYPWGWAPFHYGRWYTDAIYGPVWFPDDEWGPGWVTWRRSGDYYGWAPIGPGISITSVYINSYYSPHNRWVYANGHDFGKHNNKNYYYFNSPYNNSVVVNKSKMINNFRVDKKNNIKYNAGPKKNEIEKYTGKKITPYVIKESGKPGQNLAKNQLQIYKPKVQKNGSADKKQAPPKAVSLKNMKSPSQKANQGTNKQYQSQHKQFSQPNKQQQSQHKQFSQPNKQQQSQHKQFSQPNKQQQSQPKQSNSSKGGKK